MALRKCTDRNRIWNGLLVNSCIKTLFCKLNFNLMAIAFLQVIIRGRRPLPATLFNPFFKFPFPPFPIVGFTSPPPLHPPTIKSLTLLPLERNLNHENGAHEARVCSFSLLPLSEEEWRKKIRADFYTWRVFSSSKLSPLSPLLFTRLLFVSHINSCHVAICIYVSLLLFLLYAVHLVRHI